MTSKTHQVKMIRKRKRRAHKANRKADQKRMLQNHSVIYGQQAVDSHLSLGCRKSGGQQAKPPLCM